MTILFRYLFREYVKIFTMCFSGLMTVYLVIDFFEKVRRFLRYDADWLDVLTYFLLKVPAISFQIAPLAILMATLLTFGLLSRGHEITAMRSCGVSLLFVTSPFIVFATGISLVLLLFSSTVIPWAANKSEDIRTTRIEKKPPAAAVRLSQPWTRVGADSLMHVTSVSVGGELLAGVRLFQFDRDFRLISMTEATEASLATPPGHCMRGCNGNFPLMELFRLQFLTAKPAGSPLFPMISPRGSPATPSR
jgi:lipopolysaccharide export system permease protein